MPVMLRAITGKITALGRAAPYLHFLTLSTVARLLQHAEAREDDKHCISTLWDLFFEHEEALPVYKWKYQDMPAPNTAHTVVNLRFIIILAYTFPSCLHGCLLYHDTKPIIQPKYCAIPPCPLTTCNENESYL